MVLMMNRSSWDRKKTLPDLPGDGSSRRAWSPVSTIEDMSVFFQELLPTHLQIYHTQHATSSLLSACVIVMDRW